jgi:RiboL-PSP-HEPN
MIRANTYSKSLRDFEKSLKRAGKLCELERRRYKDPPPPRQITAVEALRGGAVVLMVAAFERYLRDAFEEYTEVIAGRAKSTKHPKLDKAFVERNDYNFVNWLVRDSREVTIAKVVEMRRVARLIAAENFIPEAFSRTRANPGPETVKELFRDFGVPDAFRLIEGNLKNRYPRPFAPGFARGQLEAIIGRRNDVAHGGGALSIARADLEGWVVFMGALGRAVDNTLRDRTLVIVAVL